MLTQKKMTIPIFDVGFRVCIFDDWSEVEDIVGDSEALIWWKSSKSL